MIKYLFDIINPQWEAVESKRVRRIKPSKNGMINYGACGVAVLLRSKGGREKACTRFNGEVKSIRVADFKNLPTVPKVQRTSYPKNYDSRQR
jgi:hypothetical protein